MLVDTHCHIHSQDYPLPLDEVEQRARDTGVTRLICVGTDADDSNRAVEFVQNRPNHWASIGIHPHEAKEGEAALQKLSGLLAVESLQSFVAGDAEGGASHRTEQREYDGEVAWSGRTRDDRINANGKQGAKNRQKIVAIGECGLDYFYSHSPKADQKRALRFQIELAVEHNLPLIFHVRDAFDDFWPIFDSYPTLRGVVHSFTDDRHNLDKLLERDLYVGINGITTFTKNDWQLENAKAVPLERLLLETDAPFLTPAPHRGKVNEPAHVRCILEFLAQLRGQSIEIVANTTTHNARQLFLI